MATQPTSMNLRSTNQDFSLSCPWVGTDLCLLAQVRETIIRGRHLGFGQMSGIQSLYHPHPLPPCVNKDGSFNFCFGRTMAEEELTAFQSNDDCPGL